MAVSIKWVGLDVHARQTMLALFDQQTGELSSKRVLGAPAAIVDALAELGADARGLRGWPDRLRARSRSRRVRA